MTRTRIFMATLFASSALLPASVNAQESTQGEAPAASEEAVEPAAADAAPEAAVADTEELPEIVVTGTLVRNPNLVASSPVLATGKDEIQLRQANVAEEILRELPGVTGNIGSAVNNGNGGASFVDMRGLGPNRNLVLLDGYRLVPADDDGSSDLNNIPLALVERIDALTGAAVTTYGADAITGVVNFVTRRNFSGFEVSASEQITEKGDGNVFRVDTVFGANLDDGRGNAVLSLGYQRAKPVYQGKRDWSLESWSAYADEAIGSSTSVPSRFSGLRRIDPATGLPSTNPATPNQNLQIDPETGTAIPGFNTFNFNPYNLFQTPFERFSIFGSAHYNISDSIEVFGRGIFSKNRVETIVAPSGMFSTSATINLDNPFLPDTLRRQFCARNVAAPDPDGVIRSYVPLFTPAECDAAAAATGPGDPNYRTVTTSVARRTVELGTRNNIFSTNFFDYRAGLRGALTSTLNWTVTGGYGENDRRQTLEGYLVTPRARQSFLVSLDASGNPVCHDTSNGCVPTDWFGEAGTISADAAGFLTADGTVTNRASLAQAHALVDGDAGFALPWASQPIGFAVGAEYRKYTAAQDADALSEAGELNGTGGRTVVFKGGYDVAEMFGELIAPLVEAKPGFESLTLEAGIRYSKYKVDAEGSPKFDTTTWKAGGSWEPGFAGLRFRGNYNVAVRAPNIGELFTPTSVQLTNLAVDPCAGAAPVSNDNLWAVCKVQGAPDSVRGAIENPSASQANIRVGGNPNLKPETAGTFTIGAVAQPDMVPGLSFSVDYYKIKIKDIISSPSTGDLIAACFGSIGPGSATNPACTSIRRDPLTGRLSGDPNEVPGLLGPLTNVGEASTEGLDATANYRRDLGFADLALNFAGNWTFSHKFQASDSAINRECAGYYSVNCIPLGLPGATGSLQPKFQFAARSTLTFGVVDLSVLWRHIGSMKFEPQQMEDDLENARANPSSCPDPEGADPNGCVVDPKFRKVDPFDYFDLAVRVAPTDRMTWTFTIRNLFDKKPPFLGNDIGTTSFNSGNTFPATYDALGRRYAVGVSLSF